MPDLDEEDAELTVKMMDIHFPSILKIKMRKAVAIGFRTAGLLWCRKKYEKIKDLSL